MRKFETPSDFARFLRTVAAEIPAAEERGKKEAAALFQKEARAMIGHYQDAAGPFPAWARLSDATLQGFEHPYGFRIPGKEELGYAPPDNPLLREGALRDSYKGGVDGKKVLLGSTSLIAVYQEMGTPNAMMPIPPRPVCGPTVFRHGEEAAKLIAREVMTAFLSGRRPNRWD